MRSLVLLSIYNIDIDMLILLLSAYNRIVCCARALSNVKNYDSKIVLFRNLIKLPITHYDLIADIHIRIQHSYILRLLL